MAKLDEDGRVVSDNGEWMYNAGGLRPWSKIIVGAPDSGKPGIRETFQAAELARQQRVEKRKAGR